MGGSYLGPEVWLKPMIILALVTGLMQLPVILVEKVYINSNLTGPFGSASIKPQ